MDDISIRILSPLSGFRNSDAIFSLCFDVLLPVGAQAGSTRVPCRRNLSYIILDLQNIPRTPRYCTLHHAAWLAQQQTGGDASSRARAGPTTTPISPAASSRAHSICSRAWPPKRRHPPNRHRRHRPTYLWRHRAIAFLDSLTHSHCKIQLATQPMRRKLASPARATKPPHSTSAKPARARGTPPR